MRVQQACRPQAGLISYPPSPPVGSREGRTTGSVGGGKMDNEVVAEKSSSRRKKPKGKAIWGKKKKSGIVHPFLLLIIIIKLKLLKIRMRIVKF
jgi:hypothetical protein